MDDAPPTPPAAPEPALQTAARLLAEGRPADAVARLAALVAGAPIYAAAHVLHATALEAAGRLDDALEAWGQAALLVPRSPLVRRERARLAARAAAPEVEEPPAEDELPGAAPSAEPPTDAADAAQEPHDLPHEAPAEHEFRLDFSEASPVEPRAELSADDDAPPSLLPVEATTGESATTDEPEAVDVSPAIAVETDVTTDESATDADEPATTDEPTADEPEAVDASPAAEDDTTPDEPADEPDLLTFESFRPGATSTPFFGDDDDATDWGDLPPLTAPILPPEAPPVDAAPEPEPEPESDWRIVEEDDSEPPVPVFEDAFETTFETPAVPADDLDALISQLEQAPRIRPDPAFNGPAVTVDESGVDDMVSETLAKIYAAQHRYVEAAVMYEKLAAREPDQADDLLRRAAELRNRR